MTHFRLFHVIAMVMFTLVVTSTSAIDRQSGYLLRYEDISFESTSTNKFDVQALTSNLTLVAQIDTPGYAEGVTIADNYAYVADGTSGLRIISIADPTMPTEVGFYDTLGQAYGVAVGGNFAYVADGSARFRVIDVTNVFTPTEIGSYFTPAGFAYGVVISGTHAFVNAGDMYILDISNPMAPTLVGSYHPSMPGGFARKGISLVSDKVFVAESAIIPPGIEGGGLRIIDAAIPINPTPLSFFDTHGLTPGGVTVVNNYAYVADGSNGLRILNVANPVTPTEVGFLDTPGNAQGVTVAGDYAYVADGSGGLRVINVGNPLNPTEFGFYDTPGNALGVVVAGDYIYVADGSNGLLVFQFRANQIFLPLVLR